MSAAEALDEQMYGPDTIIDDDREERRSLAADHADDEPAGDACPNCRHWTRRRWCPACETGPIR